MQDDPDCDKDDDDDYMQQLTSLQKDYQQLNERVNKLVGGMLQTLAGNRLPEMLQNVNATFECLDDPDPMLRRAAIHLLLDWWDSPDVLIPRIEKLAFADADHDVRGAGLLALGCCYAKSQHRRIGYRLAKVIVDPNETENCRINAYHALVRLHGYYQYPGPSLTLLRTCSDFNLAFVSTYLSCT